MESIYDYFRKKAVLNKKNKLAPSFFIKQRKNRTFINGSKKYRTFIIGDIIEFLFVFKSVPLLYSGICIAIRKKSFLIPNVTLILRNIIINVAVEVTVSFFHNRLYKLKFLDYKRKFFFLTKINCISLEKD